MVRKTILFGIAGLASLAAGAAFLLSGSQGSAEPLPIAAAYSDLPDFGRIEILRPTIMPPGLVVIVEPLAEPGAPLQPGARSLAERGWAVATIPEAIVEKQAALVGNCRKTNEAIVRLSQELEHRIRMPSYVKPVLVGIGPGATIAGALAAHAPTALYSGVVEAPTAKSFPRAPFRCPPPKHPAPLQRPLGFPVRTLPDIGTDGSALADAVDSLAEPPSDSEESVPAGLSDLPLTIVNSDARSNGDTMAVLLSGDGGWAGLDHDLAESIADAGIPVVGLDSLRYFWTARSPEQLGQDLGRIVSTYSAIWSRPRVILIGYSFGADALSRAVPVAPSWLRPHIARVSLVGLSSAADFQFHLGTWLDIPAQDALPTVPGIKAMKGLAVQCIRGADEADSACPLVPYWAARKLVLPGGHHLNNDSTGLASIILKGASA